MPVQHVWESDEWRHAKGEWTALSPDWLISVDLSTSPKSICLAFALTHALCCLGFDASENVTCGC